MLRNGGRLAEALEMAAQKAGYTRSAELGPWTQLLDQALRLQVLSLMGEHEQVLAQTPELRGQMSQLPARPDATEAAEPWLATITWPCTWGWRAGSGQSGGRTGWPPRCCVGWPGWPMSSPARCRHWRRSRPRMPGPAGLPSTVTEVVAVAEQTDGVRLGDLLAALEPDPAAVETALAEILRAAATQAVANH